MWEILCQQYVETNRLYCSPRCGHKFTSRASNRERRKTEQRERLELAQRLIADWQGSKTCLPWKEWVAQKGMISKTWLTRAVNCRLITEPSSRKLPPLAAQGLRQRDTMIQRFQGYADEFLPGRIDNGSASAVSSLVIIFRGPSPCRPVLRRTGEWSRKSCPMVRHLAGHVECNPGLDSGFFNAKWRIIAMHRSRISPQMSA